jgi:mannose-6-phosphate isomerase-like protein (cupin superfamily)
MSEEDVNNPPLALPKAVWIDLLNTSRNASGSGPQWSHESEDLDLTLLSWSKGRRIEPHVNSEVDVVWIGVEGEGVATVNGVVHPLSPGVALLIPRGCERSIESTSERLCYLSLHRRRPGIQLTRGRQSL